MNLISEIPYDEIFGIRYLVLNLGIKVGKINIEDKMYVVKNCNPNLKPD
jgi:hypothetical protein